MENWIINDEVRPSNGSRINSERKWNLDSVFAFGICEKSSDKQLFSYSGWKTIVRNLREPHYDTRDINH